MQQMHCSDQAVQAKEMHQWKSTGLKRISGYAKFFYVHEQLSLW